MDKKIQEKIKSLSMFERRVLAARVGKKVGYLNSLAYSDVGCSPEMADKLHKASHGFLDRKLMCPRINWDLWG